MADEWPTGGGRQRWVGRAVLIALPLGFLALLTTAGGARWSESPTTSMPLDPQRGVAFLLGDGSSVVIGEPGHAVTDPLVFSSKGLDDNPLELEVSEEGLVPATPDATERWLVRRDNGRVVIESPEGAVMWLTLDASVPRVQEESYAATALVRERPVELLGLAFEFREEEDVRSGPPPEEARGLGGVGGSGFPLGWAALAAGVGLLALAARRLLVGRRGSGRDRQVEHSDGVTPATRSAVPSLEHLDRAGFLAFIEELSRLEPREAIEASTAFVEQGPGRLPGRVQRETVIEWHLRVTSTVPTVGSRLGPLVDLFLLARFSDRTMTASDRSSALEALVAVYDCATDLEGAAGLGRAASELTGLDRS